MFSAILSGSAFGLVIEPSAIMLAATEALAIGLLAGAAFVVAGLGLLRALQRAERNLVFKVRPILYELHTGPIQPSMKCRACALPTRDEFRPSSR